MRTDQHTQGFGSEAGSWIPACASDGSTWISGVSRGSGSRATDERYYEKIRPSSCHLTTLFTGFGHRPHKEHAVTVPYQIPIRIREMIGARVRALRSTQFTLSRRGASRSLQTVAPVKATVDLQASKKLPHRFREFQLVFNCKLPKDLAAMVRREGR